MKELTRIACLPALICCSLLLSCGPNHPDDSSLQQDSPLLQSESNGGSPLATTGSNQGAPTGADAQPEVDPQLMLQLQRALAAVLLEQAALSTDRTASTPPVNDAARSPMTWDAGTGLVSVWHYHPGDYDQNGIVNISDLTPLAVHFGKSVPAGKPNSIEAVVDGDDNGEITIADVTPIGVNFGRVISGYNFYASSNPLAVPMQNDSPSLILPGFSVVIADAVGERSQQRLRYVWPVGQIAQLTSQFWARPFDISDDSEGTPSRVIGNGNKPPVLDWIMDPLNGPLPVDATIDASGSSDPEGGPLNFEWDPENDGSFLDGGDNLAITFENGIPLTVGIRLSDDAGNIRTSQITYSMSGSPGWHTYTVIDKPGLDGHLSSVTAGLYEGRPWIIAASWNNAVSNGVVDFNMADNQLGSSWPLQNNMLASTAEFGRYIDSVVINGQPAFCLTSMAGLLTLRRAEDLGNWQWHDLQYPLTGSAVECSMAIVRGRPMITARLDTATDIAVVRSNDALGEAWGSTVSPLSSTQNSGYGASIAEINGNAALAYYDTTDNWLRYMDSFTLLPSGATIWSNPINVEPGISSRISDSLFALQDGSPAMIFLKTDMGHLVFRRALTPTGDSFATNKILATGLSTTSQNVPRAKVINGIVHVFYYNPPTGQLMHVAANNESGSSWAAPGLVDSIASGEVIPCPFTVAGQPAVAYADSGTRQFRMAVLY